MSVVPNSAPKLFNLAPLIYIYFTYLNRYKIKINMFMYTKKKN